MPDDFSKSSQPTCLRKLFVLLILIAPLVSFSPCLAESDSTTDAGDVISLNNEGVRAINLNDFELAIAKLSAALKIDPRYNLARGNLAITYSLLAESRKSKPIEA